MALSALSFVPAHNRDQIDMEYVETMAQFMGIDLDQIRQDMKARAERNQELHEIAWRERENPNWETSKAFHRYEQVFSHGSAQVFYNDWFDRYAVYGLKSGTKQPKSLEEAVHLVYQES